MPFNKTFLKVLVLGDVAVGKSSLAHRYVNRTFSYEYRVTIGADFLLKEIEYGDNEQITLQIWDTAGQERYKAFNAPFYRGADCAIIVFDITDPLTFDHLEFWLKNLLENSQNEKIPIIVFGNRVDLKDLREVSMQKAQLWCFSRNLKYFETSAKTGENVEEAFDCLVKETLRHQNTIQVRANHIILNNDKIRLEPDKNSCC
ncbi:uncharacterized protein LOC134837903 [Culicoides brevitarsis]|uniref:uncharacterized protein LOC134837903 n=1 Tax=Culicoides brevitarsis TaxID=469753 RepID=UPI00307BB5EC